MHENVLTSISLLDMKLVNTRAKHHVGTCSLDLRHNPGSWKVNWT